MWSIDFYDSGVFGFLVFLAFMVGREFFRKEEKTALLVHNNFEKKF